MNPNENPVPFGRDPRLMKMREEVVERMTTYAKSKQRPGETEEQTFRRLAVERDPTFIEQYGLHVSLRELV